MVSYFPDVASLPRPRWLLLQRPPELPHEFEIARLGASDWPLLLRLAAPGRCLLEQRHLPRRAASAPLALAAAAATLFASCGGACGRRCRARSGGSPRARRAPSLAEAVQEPIGLPRDGVWLSGLGWGRIGSDQMGIRWGGKDGPNHVWRWILSAVMASILSERALILAYPDNELRSTPRCDYAAGTNKTIVEMITCEQLCECWRMQRSAAICESAPSASSLCETASSPLLFRHRCIVRSMLHRSDLSAPTASFASVSACTADICLAFELRREQNATSVWLSSFSSVAWPCAISPTCSSVLL